MRVQKEERGSFSLRSEREEEGRKEGGPREARRELASSDTISLPSLVLSSNPDPHSLSQPSPSSYPCLPTRDAGAKGRKETKGKEE